MSGWEGAGLRASAARRARVPPPHPGPSAAPRLHVCTETVRSCGVGCPESRGADPLRGREGGRPGEKGDLAASSPENPPSALGSASVLRKVCGDGVPDVFIRSPTVGNVIFAVGSQR